MTPEPTNEVARAVDNLRVAHDKIIEQIGKVVVGQNEVIRQLVICCFSGGHCLLVGASGLAKTLLVNALANTLELSFKRIQFTPDLMPADITGVEVLEENRSTGNRAFRFIRGPIFANIVLADEINRTPPRTQAALLEAMTERKITISGKDHSLDAPFHVFATQNPIGSEGTYPLPEAQLDRFLFCIGLRYPDLSEEIEIIRRDSATDEVRLDAILHRIDLIKFQKLVRAVPISDFLVDYAAQLVRSTRPETKNVSGIVKENVTIGAGPRASVGLIRAAKAKAILEGRTFVTLEDIQYLAYPILRHRIMLNFTAESEGLSADEVIKDLLTNLNANLD